MKNWKRKVIDAGIRMLSEGITIGTWGNVTVRDPETGYVYLSPSGMPYKTLVEDDIVVVRLDGSRVEGERKPTIETEMHLAIYRARPECNAVIHTHPVYSTAFSAMGEDIPLLLDEAAQVLGDTVRTTSYALPGSQELADECVKALGDKAMACLLRSHGAVCLGRDLEQAFGNSTVLEATAKVYSIIRSMGGQFDPISPENIVFMQNFVKNSYGQR
ncbi:class II aldolase/adducin family protein [Colidextribacter sp. OB.20]|uniref:class II aldolase/adducin family protein n=1 Tax=Colidextribacter sp. OB.20 TaxID=2304568 RepID=UPI001368D24B|nr:class II aldolase/adducin family protein [Colidextribacter sp. OB.20]NBI09798.1 class II aldolase/adducin family protein [Colidextribacter sp. OB.20]